MLALTSQWPCMVSDPVSESGLLRKASRALQRRGLWLGSGEAQVPEQSLIPLSGEKPIYQKKKKGFYCS